MEKLRNNLGTIMTLSSIAMICLGWKSDNIMMIVVGSYGFIKCMNDISAAVRLALREDAEMKMAETYAARKDADTKADLIAKAYQDGRIKDEDISVLVRSLANESSPRIVNPVRPATVSVPQPRPQQVIDVRPVEVKEENKESANNTKDVKPENNVIDYVIEGGRFKFQYNGKDLAFGPAQIIKGEAPHKECEDSIGYYKNAEGTFYIYPVDKKIVVMPV